MMISGNSNVYTLTTHIILFASTITLIFIYIGKNRGIQSSMRASDVLWILNVFLLSFSQLLSRSFGFVIGPTYFFSTWGAIVMLHGIFSILFITVIGIRDD